MNSLVEDIKSRIDIVDLVAEYVDLKRSGQNYKGLCPFHAEKTPSFMVSPSKQIFHCFGCNKGGDIFAFMMNHENMLFQEAVSYLADKAGLKIESRHDSAKAVKGIKESLFAIQKEASVFFHNHLKVSRQVIAYLKARGVNDESIETFSLGYSSNDKDALFMHLKKQGFLPEHIKASGLVHFRENSAYDFFRERLMFPISDLQGKLIAFGGRTLSSSKNIPKYINSPDSAIFKKGESSYGLNAAKNAITQKGYSIIVEGYLDTLICHQYGFHNTIAPLGTALTPGQLKKLKRFSNKVVLVFDGDAAGISATKRSIDLCFAEDMVAKILLLPHGEDPDSFLRKHGAEPFRKHLGKAISPVEFLFKISGKSKLDAVRNILQILVSCHDSLLRDETIRELADRSKINELTLREELKKTEQNTKGREQKTTNSRLTAVRVEPSVNKEEQMLLTVVILLPEKAGSILRHLDTALIESPIVSNIFEKIKDVTDSGGKALSIETLADICDEEEQKLITKLTISPEIDEEHIDKIIKGCLNSMTLKKLEKQIKSARETGDVALLRSLFSEKKKISMSSEGKQLRC